MFTNHLRHAVDLWLELRLGRRLRRRLRGARRAARAARASSLPPRAQRRSAGPRLPRARRRASTGREVAHRCPSRRASTTRGPRWELHLAPGESTHARGRDRSRGAATARDVGRPCRFDVRRARLVRRARGVPASRRRACRCDNARFDATLGARPRGHRRAAAASRRRGAARIVGAGIPWFAAPFGRDSLITSLRAAGVRARLAAETLRTLARFQGSDDDPWREEEPGKIMHELRRGEMARAGEIPHSPYYGSIDATPLWLVLLGETWRWTRRPRARSSELLPNAERALGWIERRLMRGDGCVRYQRTPRRGLENQGWKDSATASRSPTARSREPPIALVEVQGYVVGALDAMAMLLPRASANGRARRDLARAARRRCGRRLARGLLGASETGFYALASTARAGRCRPSPRTPGTSCSADAVAPKARRARASRCCSATGCSAAGACARWRAGRRSTTRSRYHNGIGLAARQRDRARWAWRATACRTRRCEILDGLLRGVAATSATSACPSCSAAWRAARATSSCTTRCRARRRRGRRARSSCCCRPCLGLDADAAGRRSICDRGCRCSAIRSGGRARRSRVSLHFQRHGARTHCDVISVEATARVVVEV